MGVGRHHSPPLRSVRLLAGAATDEMALGFARLVGMAGAGDELPRILRPLQQAAELWRLWEEPEIHWFDSGHVVHVRSPDIRRFVERALRQTGLVDS
jgi:hypothetical protein